MKKFKTIAMFMLLVLTCAGFAACSDDDDSSGDYVNMIIGSWTEEDGYGDVYTFYPDGTYSESNVYGDVFHGKYRINKNYLILIEEDYGSGSYEDVYQIRSMSKNKVVLYIEDEQEEYVFYRVD